MTTREQKDPHALMNAGWAALWLGETLEGLESYEQSYNCFCAAQQSWTLASPPRRRIAQAGGERVSAFLQQVPALDRGTNRYFDWIRTTKVLGD